MTTTPSAPVTPILLSAVPTPTADGMSIDLEFSTAMAAGSGTIFITDGAVQTVIDRASGQPVMRIVGATDTHTLLAASVSIDGSHVRLVVPDLLPGHEYSIVMGADALASSAQAAFGGLRSTSQLQFATAQLPVQAPPEAPAPAPDTAGPALLSSAIDASLLSSGGSLQVTLSFSEPVSGLTAGALVAPNATVSALVPSGDGSTWLATLTPAGAVEQAGNVLSIDMSRVHDAAGNPGKGSVDVASYTVDTKAPAGVAIALDGALLGSGGSLHVTFTFSEALSDLPASAIQVPGASISDLASLDGGRTWTATLNALDPAIFGPGASSGNLVSVDMSRLHDLNGNAGSGSFVSSESYAVDTAGPTVADIRLDGALVSTNDRVEVLIRFSEKVSLAEDAIDAPNAALQELHSTDGGLTWSAFLRPAAAADAGANLLSIDMSRVHDAARNAGSGSLQAAQAYAVDTVGPAASIVLDGADLRYGAGIGVTITLSDQVSQAELAGALAAGNASIDGLSATADPLVWKAFLKPGAGAAADTNAVTLDLGRLHDAHGNAGSGVAASSNYTVDTIVAAYVDSAIRIQDGTGADEADQVTNDSNQAISGTLSNTLQPGQHVHLTIARADAGASAVEADASSDGRAWSFGGGDYHFADGVYTLTAQVVDDAGHRSTAAIRQITIDTAGPTMLTSPDGASGNPGDELVFTFDEAVYASSHGAAAMVFTDGNGGKTEIVLGADNFSADHRTVTIAASQHHLLAGNAYTIALSNSITDLAGNPLQHAAPLHFSTSGGDTLAPWATAALVQAAPGIYGLGKEIDIAVSFSEAVRQAGAGAPVLHLNNGGIATWDHLSADARTVFFKYVVGANGERDTAGAESLRLADNTDLAGHVSDLAGNLLDQAHIAFSTLDTAGIVRVDAHAPGAPGAPLLANDTGVAGDGITSALAFAGSGAEASATIKLFDNGTLVGSTLSGADGNWSIGNLRLTDGAHTLVARQVDGAGNESAASAALTIGVDTIAPNKPGKPILSASSDSGSSDHDGLTNDATPTLSGVAAEAGGTIELYVNGGTTALASASVGAGDLWSLTIPDNLALANGVNSLTVRQVDAAGNRGASSDALPIQVKTTAPATLASAVLDAASDSGSSDHDGITNRKTPTISGAAAEAGARINVYDGLTLLGTTTAGSNGAWSFTVGSQGGYPAALVDGLHMLTVRQLDTAGNLSAAAAPLAITIDTVAPTIVASTLDWNSDKHRFKVEFSEKIVFAPDRAIDVLDVLGLSRSHHAGNAKTNWTISANDQGLASVLELNLGGMTGLPGHFSLKVDPNTILDLAGNAAVIGIPGFDIPGLLH